MVETPALKQGMPVQVLWGKYEGCPGLVDKISPTTGKFRVCRTCTSAASSGISCCGSSTRTQCWYYKDTDLSITQLPLPPSNTIDHSNYFSMTSMLKCTGKKTAGTWNCAQTLSATPPPSVGSGGSKTVGCKHCPQKGDVGWQGDVPALVSNFVAVVAASATLKTNIKRVDYTFGSLWLDARTRGVARFEYTARLDCGCLDRHSSFKISPSSYFPAGTADIDIQQTSTQARPPSPFL